MEKKTLMKAIVIHQAGNPDQLKLEKVPIPKIKEGWSLVKIKGFGINRSEIITRKGQSPDVKFPRILGIECVGVVTKTTDPKRLPIGQKVISIMGGMGRSFNGSYAEYALLPNNQLYPVNTNLNWRQLAALPETYYTAFGSLLNLKINKYDSVLVRGGTSGVGLAFTNLIRAKYPDIKIFGTTRSLEKEQKMKEAGYDEVFLDRDNKLDTNKKFDKILELIGAATIKDSLLHLNEEGILCNTGALGGIWSIKDFDPIGALGAIAPNSYLTGFVSGMVNETKLNQMLDYMNKYHVIVKPAKVFDLEHVADAHRYLESKHSFGKVIVMED